MIKSYKLRIFGNRGKLEKLDELLRYYRDEVNRRIHLFWNFKEVKGAYPPKEYRRGDGIINHASDRAWNIVKSARASRQKEEPFFITEEIDLDKNLCRIIPDLKTKEYDLWLSVRSLEPRKRFRLPCKRYKSFNHALEKGELRRSFKLKKIRGDYYAFLFVNFPEKQRENKKVIGLDVGLSHTVATSDGKFFGDGLRNLRIRTKWRHYKKGLPAFQQGLNRIAKEIMERYPDYNFAVEKLSLKGKRKRNRTFRRNNLNWSYAYLSHKLEEWSKLKGFRLLRINPRHTSQRCPACDNIDKANRKGEVFACTACHYTEHADVVGALNCERVAQELSSLKSTFVG